MAVRLSDEEVRRRLRERYEWLRSYRTLAAESGVPKSVLNDYLEGGRDLQGPNWAAAHSYAAQLTEAAMTRPPNAAIVADAEKELVKRSAKKKRRQRDQ